MSRSEAFERQRFKPLTLEGTTIAVWEERDRLHICLSRKDNDRTLIEWWDDDARQAIEDGFLDTSDVIMGRLGSNPRQGGKLHQSAFDYWQQHFQPKKRKATA